ncbi:MAG: hypothetical protein EOP49_11155 [Sphingobacteriales bacterium]|nr:MAG: hypothetical protein EOP49_11155 [Sphingobacteriales bacterium]
MRTVYILLCLVLLAASGCKKEKNMVDLLTGPTWKMKALIVNNQQELVHPCREDNTYRFFADGSFVLNNGGNLCVEGEEVEMTGTWELTPNGRRMNIIYTGVNLTYDVLKISADELEFQLVLDTATVREIYRP